LEGSRVGVGGTHVGLKSLRVPSDSGTLDHKEEMKQKVLDAIRLRKGLATRMFDLRRRNRKAYEEALRVLPQELSVDVRDHVETAVVLRGK